MKMKEEKEISSKISSLYLVDKKKEFFDSILPPRKLKHHAEHDKKEEKKPLIEKVLLKSKP